MMAKKKKKPLDLETLQKRHKKNKKRIEELEGDLSNAQAELEELRTANAALEEQVLRVDERTLRMGMALRKCMQKLGVARPTGPVTKESL